MLDRGVGCLWLVFARGSGIAGGSAGAHAATLVCSLSREARSARCTSVIETMPTGLECSSMTTARPTLAKAGRSRSRGDVLACGDDQLRVAIGELCDVMCGELLAAGRLERGEAEKPHRPALRVDDRETTYSGSERSSQTRLARVRFARGCSRPGRTSTRMRGPRKELPAPGRRRLADRRPITTKKPISASHSPSGAPPMNSRAPRKIIR